MSIPSGGIPLAKDASSRLLPLLIAVLVFLAGLALFSVLSMHRIAAQWDQGDAGDLTIQLPPVSAFGPDDASNATTAVDRAILILQETPGVVVVEQMAPEDIDRLLEPWLGMADASQSLPLPQLIAVSLDGDKPADVEALSRKITAAIPDALVEDHRSGIQSLVNLAQWIRTVSGAAVALILAATILTVVLVTRMGLAAHSQVIELLHLMGAEDAFVAAQFQWRALQAGVIGGLLGLAAALGTIAVIEGVLSRIEQGLVPDLALTLPQWAAFGLLPLLTAAVTMLTARLTVLRSLARLP